MGLKITGKLPAGDLLKALKRSPQNSSKGFHNISETPMMAEDASYWKLTRDYFKKHPHTRPPGPLPSVKTNLFDSKSSHPMVVWFGHSSYFIRINGQTILVDPVFSGNAAPVSFMVKAFPGSDIFTVDDLPPVDYLVLTHDHYDHLDYKTILQLNKKTALVICSLGISSHLTYWGFDEKKIIELDWWEARSFGDIKFTAAPARHFSGRGLKRNQTLWSSFILQASDYRIYLGGDSGYDTHFKQIGEKFGPFDLVILESGQYNAMWPLIHMMPEQTVEAAADLKGKLLLPVHWGKFLLSMHPWNEPVIRVLTKAKELGIYVTTPRIGEPVFIGQAYPVDKWWESIDNRQQTIGN